MLELVRRPANAPWLLLAAAAAALGGAWTLQYGFGLPPCELCIWQRWPWGIAAAAALAALLLRRGGRPARWALAAAGLATLAGAGIAFFHVGVEQHWWQGLTSCTGTVGRADTLEALRAQVMAAPVVRCDEPQGVFLGLSLAGWNALASVAAAGLALGAAARLGGGRA